MPTFLSRYIHLVGTWKVSVRLAGEDGGGKVSLTWSDVGIAVAESHLQVEGPAFIERTLRTCAYTYIHTYIHTYMYMIDTNVRYVSTVHEQITDDHSAAKVHNLLSHMNISKYE